MILEIGQGVKLIIEICDPISWSLDIYPSEYRGTVQTQQYLFLSANFSNPSTVHEV